MSQPIRVLHVLQRMEAGGTQSLLMNLYRNIDRTKIQFDFLVQYQEKQFYDDEIESLGGHIYRSSVREDFNLFKYTKYLKSFFATHKEYDIVHCHAYTYGFFVLKAAAASGVPVRIAHSHSNKMSGIAVPAKMIMRQLFPIYATNLMAASKEAGKFLFGNRDFLVVKNAIDVEKFKYDVSTRQSVRNELGISDNYVIGNVGRLHMVKNQEFLLDVFQQVQQKKQNARLLMVGDGPLRGQIQSKIEKLNLQDHVIMLNNCHEMNKLYQAMDVFALPSLFEGLGIVTIEAQSAGLPTICSDGVSCDANISELFQQVPLQDGTNAWADAILKVEGIRDPKSGQEGAFKHGFDVKTNSIKMQNWYIEEAMHVKRK